MLESIMQGLFQWGYSMFLETVEYAANSLLNVFGMDMAFFESSIPVTKEIIDIVIAVGWALLIGNLVFQALKTMMSGLGFEGEDPKQLFLRTFVFSFLLLVSRQICAMGLSITSKVIELLQIPSSVTVPSFAEDSFTINASWVLVIIIGIIVMIQIVKLFFEIGERYVIVGVLTILSPLAFGMGGSKNTLDIFKGWCRMYGSMCLMMVFNVVFLKLLISAMSVLPSGIETIPWVILIVAIARVARKIDGVISRIGLNPAATGDPLGHSRMPGMLALTVARSLASTVVKTSVSNKSTSNAAGYSRHSASASSFSGTGRRSGTAKPAGAASGTSTAQSPNSEQQAPTNQQSNVAWQDSSFVQNTRPDASGGFTGRTARSIPSAQANKNSQSQKTDLHLNNDKSKAQGKGIPSQEPGKAPQRPPISSVKGNTFAESQANTSINSSNNTKKLFS